MFADFQIFKAKGDRATAQRSEIASSTIDGSKESDRFAIKSSNKIAYLFLDCYGYFQTLSEIPQVEATVEPPALKIVKNEAG